MRDSGGQHPAHRRAQKTGPPTSDPDPRQTRNLCPFRSPSRPEARPLPRVEAGERRPRAVPPRPHSPAPAWRSRAGPRAAASAEVVSKAGLDAAPEPWLGGSEGSGGDLGRWPGRGGPGGVARARGSARRRRRRRQVRAERGALCGGGAGTAVRAAPAAPPPRLGTRAGSAGASLSAAPRSASGPGARQGRPPPCGPRGSRDPTAGLLPSSHLRPRLLTLGPGQAPAPILEGKEYSRSTIPEGGRGRGSPRVLPRKAGPGPHRQAESLRTAFPSAPRECLRAVPAHRCPAQAG